MATSTAATRKKAGSKKHTAKKTTARKTSSRNSTAKKSAAKKKAPRKWSRHANETSDAMDLEQGVFKKHSPKKIAQSLKRSSTKSKRKKGTPYQSAMSMLNFYINRGGKKLSAAQKKILEKA